MNYVYIATALTHVKRDLFDEYVSFIIDLAKNIEQSFSIPCKYALRDSDPKLSKYRPEERPRLCYLWDRDMVENAKFIIAEVSFPSTGVGMEIEIANQKGIPILLVYREFKSCKAEVKNYRLASGEIHVLEIGNRIASVMVQGCPSIIHEIEYKDSDDGIKKTINYLSSLKIESFSNKA